MYHGSQEIVMRPEWGKGKIYNDYGQGFYCTEHLELAKEWAYSERQDGYVNEYRLNAEGLCILNLSDSRWNILHWLALLAEYRKFRLSTPIMKRGAEWLRSSYLIELSDYDIVIGYRADDSYFSFARAFLNNEISLEQLSYAMKLDKLGEQIVLKSKETFERIKFVSFERVDNTEYYAKRKTRDEQARHAYQKELEKYDIEGHYIRDFLRNEV